MNRTRSTPGATGNLFYNTTSLLARSAEVGTLLASTVYADGPAIPPATPWLDSTPPAPVMPVVAEGAGTAASRVWRVQMGAPAPDVRWWILRARTGGAWRAAVVLPATVAVHDVDVPRAVGGGALESLALYPADAVWNVGAASIWRPAAVLATH